MRPQLELQARIGNYRRHNEFKKALLDKVMAQSKEKGIEYVLSNISDEARELYKRSREVMCEAHYAISYLRFKEDNGTLIAKADFDHAIERQVLLHFIRRFPKKKIVIISKSKAYVSEGLSMRIEDTKKYQPPKDIEIKEKDELWETFYNSQYIPARRNRKLAMSHIPKKLWKKFGITEGKKIDHNIPNADLTYFM